jgi:hypothetical protein
MKKLHIILIAVALALTGCAEVGPSQNAEELFREMYKDCSMNEALHLDFLMESMYAGGKEINFFLESIPDVSVIFPAGFNLKLLSFDEDQNKWVEIRNNIQYLPADAKYIVGKNNPSVEIDHILVGIAPALGTKRTLRVVVHGHIYKDGVETSDCVGAFADFTFVP